ncbi:MAG: hypothetical protein NC217_08140 [Muribaculaceae bacterium]|nr:hypothetical protein [Muribaculaceae bacterium]
MKKTRILIGPLMLAGIILMSSGCENKRKHRENEDDDYTFIKGNVSKKDKEAESKEVALPKEEASSVFHDGANYFNGTFNYKGSKYGFTVTFLYDAITHNAYNATYEADGYGSVSDLNISISNGGMNILLTGVTSGANTVIDVRSNDGAIWSGTMVKGDHDGTCRMTLQ